MYYVVWIAKLQVLCIASLPNESWMLNPFAGNLVRKIAALTS